MRALGLVGLVLSLILLAPQAVLAGLEFEACATGEQEAPPPGHVTDLGADVQIDFDSGLTQVHVVVDITNVGTVSNAHFHCNRAGANGPVAFGLIVPGPCALEGSQIECTLTNANWSGVDCVPLVGQPINNIAALHAGMEAGLIYFNLHTPDNPAGEIRGQVGGPGHGCADDDEDDESEDGSSDQYSEEDHPGPSPGMQKLQPR